VRTTGLELQASLRPTPDWLLHLAYAYAKAGRRLHHQDRGRRTGVPTPRGNPRPAEPSVPEHTLTLMAAREFGDGWRLSGTAYHVSEMEWLGEGDFVDRVARFDAKLSKRFRHPAGDVQLSLNVQNVLDDPYWEFTSSFPDDGVVGNLGERRIYAEIRMDLR
jgi:outer membrane receptor protein involved in Fe transport